MTNVFITITLKGTGSKNQSHRLQPVASWHIRCEVCERKHFFISAGDSKMCLSFNRVNRASVSLTRKLRRATHSCRELASESCCSFCHSLFILDDRAVMKIKLVHLIIVLFTCVTSLFSSRALILQVKPFSQTDPDHRFKSSENCQLGSE